MIYVKASDLDSLVPNKTHSTHELVHVWQQRMCSRINLALGSHLDLAFDEDSMAIVEQAELSGFRGKNMVGSLLSRLSSKHVGIELISQDHSKKNQVELLARIQQSGSATVWLLIDDIDATFLNTPEERIRISTFFSACRDLVSTIDGVNIRASVRSDVWAVINQYDEALDKCRQYMLDLFWSRADLNRLLNNRVISYIDRQDHLSEAMNPDVDDALSLVFRNPIKWQSHNVPPIVPITVLSGNRPRWAIGLCRLVGIKTKEQNGKLIDEGHIGSCMLAYGNERLLDIYKEHRHQCNRLEVIVQGLGGSKVSFTSLELLQHIESKITDVYSDIEIDGVSSSSSQMTVAAFLFRIGVITLKESTKQFQEPIYFEDRPHLLKSTNNPDDGGFWEISPIFRRALGIRPGKT